MDAGVPIKAPVAGISCGLIQDDDGSFTTFIDIQGVEDFHGEMDFKVGGTKKGITAIQMDLKNDGLTMEIIKNALDITYDARCEILDQIMLPCIAEPRPEVSKWAPKMITMHIDPDNIRDVIGKGGSVIQKIVADTGAKIDIDDDGTIHIASADAASCDAAKAAIDAIVFVPEVGQLYYGRVVRLMQFGAFVELAPGKDGLVHISKLANKRVEKVEDVCKIGDMMWVKVTEIDEKGRVNLSHKDAVKEIEARRPPASPSSKSFLWAGMCPPTHFFGGSAPGPRSDGAGPAHLADAGLKRPSPGGWERNIFPPNRCDSARNLSGLRPRTPGYFSLAGKVPKRAHKGGTLSMGSLPYGSLPRDDTKGGACPPLDTPAGAETCPLSNTLSSIRTAIHFSRSWCGSIV